MPELTSMDMKMNLEAVGGEATTQLLTSLADLATKLASALADIGKADLSTVESQATAIADSLSSAVASLDDLPAAADKSKASLETITTSLESAATAAENISTGIDAAAKKATVNPYEAWAASLTTAATDSTTLSDNTSAAEKDASANPFEKWATSLSSMASDIKTVQTAMGQIGSDGKTSPFDTWVAATGQIDKNVTSAYETMLKLSEIKAPSVPVVNSGGSPGGKRGTGPSKSSVPTDYAKWFTGLNVNSMPEPLQQAYQQYKDQWLGWGGVAANENAPKQFYGEYEKYYAKPERSPSPTPGRSSSSSSHGHGSLFSGNSLMNMAMNGMMGYYGLQALSQGASNFAYIQQIMKQGLGMSRGTYGTGAVNRAAQVYTMLSSVGLSGGAGADFLSGLSSTLTNMFTQTNSSPLGKDALLLQHYGVTKQMTVTSPWEALQGIQRAYMGLMNSGQVQDAANLLGNTGTSQLATAFGNWKQLEQDTSGINLGMNSAQLQKAVASSVNLNTTLAKLGVSFDQFALAFAPAAKKIASGLTDIANVLSGKVSVQQGLKDFTKDIGTTGAAIVGVATAIKAVKMAGALGTFVSNVGGLGKSAGEAEKGVSSLAGVLGGSGFIKGLGAFAAFLAIFEGSQISKTHANSVLKNGGKWETLPNGHKILVDKNGDAVGQGPLWNFAQNLFKDIWGTSNVNQADNTATNAFKHPRSSLNKKHASPDTKPGASNAAPFGQWTPSNPNEPLIGTTPPPTTPFINTPVNPALRSAMGAFNGSIQHIIKVDVQSHGETKIDDKAAQLIASYVMDQASSLVRLRTNVDLAY